MSRNEGHSHDPRAKAPAARPSLEAARRRWRDTSRRRGRPASPPVARLRPAVVARPSGAGDLLREAAREHLSSLLSRLGEGLAATIRRAARLQERLERLGRRAGLEPAELVRLRDAVLSVAGRQDLRLDPGRLLEAVEQVVAQTGGVELARENLLTLGQLIRATGAGGGRVGSLVAGLARHFGLRGPRQIRTALEALWQQGKGGSSLSLLAGRGEGAVSAYAALGRRGPRAVAEMGALWQSLRRDTPDPHTAAVRLETVVDSLMARAPRLHALGVELWDPARSAPGKRVARPLPQVLEELMAAVEGDPARLEELLGRPAARALEPLRREYRRSGGLDSLRRAANPPAQSDELARASARRAQGRGGVLQRLQAVGTGLLLRHLGSVVVPLGRALDLLAPRSEEAGSPGTAAGGGTPAEGRAAVPVEVVNWPPGLQGEGASFSLDLSLDLGGGESTRRHRPKARRRTPRARRRTSRARRRTRGRSSAGAGRRASAGRLRGRVSVGMGRLGDAARESWGRLRGRGGAWLGRLSQSRVGRWLAGGLDAAGRLGRRMASRGVGKAVGDGVRWVGERLLKRGAAKLVSRGLSKNLLKKIPGVSLVVGGVLACQRAKAGDWWGALGELASGIAGSLPGWGTAVSTAIDTALAVRDVMRDPPPAGEEAAGKSLSSRREPRRLSPPAVPAEVRVHVEQVVHLAPDTRPEPLRQVLDQGRERLRQEMEAVMREVFHRQRRVSFGAVGG